MTDDFLAEHAARSEALGLSLEERVSVAITFVHGLKEAAINNGFADEDDIEGLVAWWTENLEHDLRNSDARGQIGAAASHIMIEVFRIAEANRTGRVSA